MSSNANWTRLQRPLFPPVLSGGGSGSLLTIEHSEQLSAAIPARAMTAEQRGQFVARLDVSAQYLRQYASTVAGEEIRSQIDSVSTRARALLQSIAALSTDGRLAIELAARDIAEGRGDGQLSAASVSLCLDYTRNEEMLPHWWAQIQDLEAAARQAAPAIQSGKHCRPALMNARRLVRLAVHDFECVMKQRPPRSKGGWFVPFLETYGELVGFSVKPALAVAVLQELPR